MWVPKSGEILLEEGGAGAGPWATGSGPQGQERNTGQRKCMLTTAWDDAGGGGSVSSGSRTTQGWHRAWERVDNSRGHYANTL